MASYISVNNFERYKKALHAEQDKRVARAAIVVMRHAKRLLSVSGTGTRKSITGVTKRAIKTGKGRVYGWYPSKPGESPHKQTGALRMAVARLAVQLVASLQDAAIIARMPLRRRDVADAAVAMLVVVPTHEVRRPLTRVSQISEAVIGELRSVLRRAEQALHEGVVVAVDGFSRQL